jgi:hypothetical protein
MSAREPSSRRESTSRSNCRGFQVTSRRGACDADCVPHYLVETYTPVNREAEAKAGFARIGEGGAPVRHLRVTFIPEDETCFHIVEGPSLDAVCEALAVAAVSYERIVEAIE